MLTRAIRFVAGPSVAWAFVISESQATTIAAILTHHPVGIVFAIIGLGFQNTTLISELDLFVQGAVVGLCRRDSTGIKDPFRAGRLIRNGSRRPANCTLAVTGLAA